MANKESSELGNLPTSPMAKRALMCEECLLGNLPTSPMAKRVRTCEECVRRSIPLFIGLTNRQLAFGFDVNYNKQLPPRLVLVPCTWSKNYVIGLYGRIGLQCYNLQKTQFSDAGSRISLGTRITWFTIASRIKQIRNEPVDDEWEEEDTPGIHEFYKVPMPKWFSDEALERDSKKYYVVPESDLHDNDWLQLLMEVAFFSKADRCLDAYLPLELKNVVVETFEYYTTVSGVAVQDVLSPPITTQSVYMKKNRDNPKEEQR